MATFPWPFSGKRHQIQRPTVFARRKFGLANAELTELQLLSEQVPDKRVAISTPINQPSRTTLPEGKAKFLVFRRDLAGSALDRIEVRVVARVARAQTFDSKGKPNWSPVDTWNIRSLSYEFKVRPIAANPEMRLLQPRDADLTATRRSVYSCSEKSRL